MVDGLEGPLKAWFFWVWVLLVCWFGVGKNFDSSILLCDLNHYPSLLLLLFVWGFCRTAAWEEARALRPLHWFATSVFLCISVYCYTHVFLHWFADRACLHPWPTLPLTLIFLFLPQVVFDFDTVFVVLWICLHPCIKWFAQKLSFVVLSLSYLLLPSLSQTVLQQLCLQLQLREDPQQP